jgi:hypothetical protein
MDAVPYIHETTDINSLINDYLSFSKFDKNYVIVKDSKGLPGVDGLVTKPLCNMYYIKPGKAQTVLDSVSYVANFFNEYSEIAVGARIMSLREVIDTLAQRL